MKKTLKLLEQEFESSSGLTPQFQEFFCTFKKEFTAELKKRGCKDIEISRGHFYASGFFSAPREDGTYGLWYFSISDVRYFPKSPMLYRTAEHRRDFTGGSNQHISWSADMVANLNLTA